MEKDILSIWEQLLSIIVTYGSQLLGAIIILVIGWWLINRIVRTIKKILVKRDVEISLHPFLTSIVKYTLRAMLIIAVAGMIGIEMTSFIAALGAAGIAIGMALQGSLSNLAGGVIILILKPFKVGDWIEAEGGITGSVREIRIFHTYITTYNRQELIVPNGKLANVAITNYSKNDIRGVGITFSLPYEYDIDKVKTILNDLIESKSALVKDPAHVIKVSSLSNAYRTFSVQAWFKLDEYWSIVHPLPEEINKQLEAGGIRLAHGQSISVEMKS